MSGDGTGKGLVARGRALAHFRLDGETTPSGLLPAEEKLLIAAREGELCNIGEVRPEQASRDNTVRAPFIRFLALGGDTDAPIHEQGVQLRGAFIEDVLDLEGCEGVRPLFLWNCWCERKIVLRDACTRTINLSGSRVLGIQGDRSNISGSVFLGNCFAAHGEVRFLGAEIGGQLNCKNGRFENASGYALHCDGAKISRDVFLSGGFASQGEVRFVGAEIGGDVSCFGGRFANQRAGSAGDNATDGPSCAIALNLDKALIKGTLWLGPTAGQEKETVIEGSLDLSDAYASVLVDHQDFWPEESVSGRSGEMLSCHIYLDGFTYGSFAGKSSLKVAERKAWLERQSPRDLCEDFKPQPFEQLAKVLRQMGHVKDARHIAIFKEEKQLRRPTRIRGKEWPWYWNPWNWLRWLGLEVAIGHGYRPQRLFGAALALWAFGAIFFTLAAHNGVMAPANPIVFLDPQLDGCRINWTTCDDPRMANEHTTFQPVLYALDVMLPIVALGQEAAWAPMVKPWEVGEIPVWRWLAISVMWFEIIFGWAVGLLAVAVVSGAVRRE